MTLFNFLRSALLTLVVGQCVLLASPDLTAPSVTVGRNLQTVASVRLPAAPPEAGLQITVTSDDPSRLLIAPAADKPGVPSITITAHPPFLDSPEFCLQGKADKGTVGYSVSVPGVGTYKGTVTLAPSAILVLGPQRAPKYPMTPGAPAARITIVAAMLDESLKVAGQQPLAGGVALEINLNNSNPKAGKLKSSKITLAGDGAAVTAFEPAAEGDAVISAVQPAGFTVPSQFASVVMSVDKPGLSIVGDIYVGKDLQVTAILCLGDPAPPEGLKVTITSADPSKLLLSADEKKLGAGTLVLTVPAGKNTAQYYLQGMSDTGIITYDAAAKGYRSREAKIGLAPSGFIVAYDGYGPPDEASVVRKGGTKNTKEFYASLADAKQHPVLVGIWPVRLDPVTGCAADITVQPLRPGVSATVLLESSDPAVGTVESNINIKPGDEHVVARFTPLTKGKTMIRVNTPTGFSTPQNATIVPANVVQ
jgi:hypothetical protein